MQSHSAPTFLTCFDIIEVIFAFSLQIHHVEVRNGEGAYDAFLTEIRRIFCITEDHDMQLAFDCADPVTGDQCSCCLKAP